LERPFFVASTTKAHPWWCGCGDFGGGDSGVVAAVGDDDVRAVGMVVVRWRWRETCRILRGDEEAAAV
ncbi:hypothetical protein Tco_0063784, partial [Tanacetum coccineum]